MERKRHMLNFDYHIGTEIFFGRGQLAKLPAAIRRCTDKVLLCYGGGSVKRTGLLDEVQSALRGAGISYVELAGVESGNCNRSMRSIPDLRTNDYRWR